MTPETPKPKSEAPTPRTDAAAIEINRKGLCGAANYALMTDHAEQLERELAAAQAWQDIATAPRDGTRVQIYGGTWTYRHADREFALTHVEIADFCDDEWSSGFIEDGTAIYNKPTHWRELPQPPTPSKS